MLKARKRDNGDFYIRTGNDDYTVPVKPTELVPLILDLAKCAGADVLRIERHGAIVSYDLPGAAYHFLRDKELCAPYPVAENDTIIIMRAK